MRKGTTLATALLLAACGGGGGGGGDTTSTPPDTVSDPCSVEAKKQFVLDRMREWYLWADRLPAQVRLEDYASPEDLLWYLTDFRPKGVPRFSFIDTASADAAFFGEGQFEHFGFRFAFFDTDGDGLTDEIPVVLVYQDSPAGAAGLARGQRIVAVDGRTVEEIAAAAELNTVFAPDMVQLRIRRLDGTIFEVVLTKGLVTIDALPQARVIDTTGGAVGYMEFRQFIGTVEGADGPLAQAFSLFRDAAVSDLVIDLRYNGGGLVRVANLLGDYLGGFIATDEVFSRTLYNEQNASSNSVELFENLDASLNLSRLVIIGTRNTASASELVTNSMFPYADVFIVGTPTFGKPVGQRAETLMGCDFILRPVAFETVNALGEGGYFDGLPADCPAPDSLDFPIGDDQDPMLTTALELLATGACPAAKGLQKRVVGTEIVMPEQGPFRRGLVSDF